MRIASGDIQFQGPCENSRRTNNESWWRRENARRPNNGSCRRPRPDHRRLPFLGIIIPTPRLLTQFHRQHFRMWPEEMFLSLTRQRTTGRRRPLRSTCPCLENKPRAVALRHFRQTFPRKMRGENIRPGVARLGVACSTAASASRTRSCSSAPRACGLARFCTATC